jgi:3D (Asp-Asp-Asp) domain-containing protein
MLVALFIFLALGEVNSPIEAQGEPSSMETTPVFVAPTTNQNSIRIYTTITGYSSSYDETDDTPWLTAAGTIARNGIAASNFLPLGTKIRIPKLFGQKTFVIEDRLHSRFYDRIDIWFPTKWEAKHFGIHSNILIESVQ